MGAFAIAVSFSMLLCSMGIKVFRFDHKEGGISYAKVDAPEDVELEDIFTICFSHRQKVLDETNVLTFYKDNGSCWLALGRWVADTKTYIWAQRGTNWKRLTPVEKFKINLLIHICLEVDTINDLLRISIDGNKAVAVKGVNMRDEKPEKLNRNLVIGKSDSGEPLGGQTQFVGDVASIKMFNATTDLENLTQSFCFSKYSMFDLSWNIFGNVETYEQEDYKICENKKPFDLMIHTQVCWQESLDLCKRLNSGSVHEIKDESDMYETLIKMKERSCEAVWTTINDIQKEDEFVKGSTGLRASYLPWGESEPNHGRSGYCVALKHDPVGFADLPCGYQKCASCIVNVEDTFRFLGVCESTFLGRCSSQGKVQMFVQFVERISSAIIHGLLTIFLKFKHKMHWQHLPCQTVTN